VAGSGASQLWHRRGSINVAIDLHVTTVADRPTWREILRSR
jgi:hypothetical protein